MTEDIFVERGGISWKQGGNGEIYWWDENPEEWIVWTPGSTSTSPPMDAFRQRASGTPTRFDPKERGAALTIVAGAALAVVGSLLPWINVTTAFGGLTRSGAEGGDGIITLIVAVLVGLTAASTLGNYQITGILSYSPIVGAVVIGGLTAINHVDINERVSGFQAEVGGLGTANVGAGIWLLYIGAAIMAFGWWNGRETRGF